MKSLYLFSLLAFLSFLSYNAQAQVNFNNGTVSAWTFDSSDARDVVGTNDGTIMGATGFVPGVKGMAADLPGGIDDYIVFDPVVNHGLNDTVTIAFWFYVDSIASTYNMPMAQHVESLTDPRVGTGFNVESGSTTRPLKIQVISAHDSTMTVGHMRTEFSGILPQQQWTHVVTTITAHKSWLWVDGVLIMTDSSTAPVLGTTIPFKIGSNYAYPWSGGVQTRANAEFNGKVDQVYQLNRRLTQAEIDILSDSTKDDPTFATTSISETASLAEELLLYPNPASDQLHIESTTKGPIDVTLYNLNGQAVLSSEQTAIRHDMDISILPVGLYVVKISAQNGDQLVKRVLIEE